MDLHTGLEIDVDARFALRSAGSLDLHARLAVPDHGIALLRAHDEPRSVEGSDAREDELPAVVGGRLVHVRQFLSAARRRGERRQEQELYGWSGMLAAFQNNA